MIILEDDYVEHFGTKGMKWGVRKKSSSGGEKKGMSDKTKKRVKIGVGAAVVVGAAAAAIILSRNSGRSVGSLNSSTKNVGKGVAKEVLRNRVRVAARPHNPRRPVMNADAQKWIKEFSAKQTVLNRDANADLRTRDNALNIPFANRSYLRDWN